MNKAVIAIKAISILLVLTFACSQVYADVSSFSNNKLAASLVTDSNINPTRSKSVQNDIAGKVEPGAIGNGVPLIELAQGKLQLDQARVQLDMAKLQMEVQGKAQGGLVAPPEKSDHEKNVDGIGLIIKEKLADAKVMETKIKAAEMQQKAQNDKITAALKQEDMLAKERIQMIDLAQNIAVHPESDAEVRDLLGNVIPSITRQ